MVIFPGYGITAQVGQLSRTWNNCIEKFYIYKPEQQVDIRTSSFPASIAKTQSEKSHSVVRLYNKPVRFSDNEITASVNRKYQERTHVESR